MANDERHRYDPAERAMYRIRCAKENAESWQQHFSERADEPFVRGYGAIALDCEKAEFHVKQLIDTIAKLETAARVLARALDATGGYAPGAYALAMHVQEFVQLTAEQRVAIDWLVARLGEETG